MVAAMRGPAATFALLALVAGCLQQAPARPDYTGLHEVVEELALPQLAQDHGSEDGHFEASLHAGSKNLELVAYHNGVDSSGDPNAIAPGATYSELTVTPDHVYLARNSQDGSEGGFVILSTGMVGGIPTLRKVGDWNGLGAVDIEVNDRETLAFVAVQRNTIEQMVANAEAHQDPTADFPRGIQIVDISDKANPALELWVPLPYNGPHTITYHHHANGNEYLVVSTYDLLGNTIPSSSVPAPPVPFAVNPVTQRVLVYQIMGLPPGLPATPGPSIGLLPVGQFQIPENAPTGKLFFPHDTRIQQVGDRTLLYVAYWDKGVRVLDFSNPAAPAELSGWTDFAPSSMNNIHLAQAFDELIDGRRILVAEPEIVSALDETGQITFLDVTEPERIRRADPVGGYWELPGDNGVIDLDFSPHNFDLWDGKVALGHYHAGVWIIDVSDAENLREPKSVGYYMPSKPRTDSPAHQPTVWGVVEDGGLLWVSDEPTGLYVLRYTGP